MSKVSIHIRPEDLQIVDDEFRYKYTYRDIDYMLTEAQNQLNIVLARKQVATRTLEDLTSSESTLTQNIDLYTSILSTLTPPGEDTPPIDESNPLGH